MQGPLYFCLDFIFRNLNCYSKYWNIKIPVLESQDSEYILFQQYVIHIFNLVSTWELMTSRIIFVFLGIIISLKAQFYSQRTKCSSNQLSFDSQISLFFQNTQYSGVAISQMTQMMGYIKKLYHYGKKVDQAKIGNHRCKNYFMHQQICCRYSDLDQFTFKLVDLYQRTYHKSKHPMVDYLYNIYDQYKQLNSYCLNYYDLRLPDRNGYGKQNATQPLGDLFSWIQNQLRQIKQFQLDFIYNSACALCLGVQDLKTFIHPIHQDVKKTKRLIFNQQYFSNVTSFIANRMLRSKEHSDRIQSFIQNQLRNRVNSASECSSLANLIRDSTQISKRKVCDSYEQCLRFAEKFIGAPGAPAYSKMFTSVQLKRGITKTNFKLVTQSQWGFKGNQIYQRYLGVSVPLVEIKGNQYTYA